MCLSEREKKKSTIGITIHNFKSGHKSECTILEELLYHMQYASAVCHDFDFEMFYHALVYSMT